MAACMPRCAMARWRPSDCGSCWLRTCRVDRRCLRWTRRCGRAVMRSASPGRGFYYHPSRHSAGQPIVAGWCYQLVVGLELQRDSWTAPVDVRRLDPADNSNLVAAGQIRALLVRLAAQQPVPLVVFDGGFDPVQLQVELAGAPVQVLVRIR